MWAAVGLKQLNCGYGGDRSYKVWDKPLEQAGTTLSGRYRRQNTQELSGQYCVHRGWEWAVWIWKLRLHGSSRQRQPEVQMVEGAAAAAAAVAAALAAALAASTSRLPPPPPPLLLLSLSCCLLLPLSLRKPNGRSRADKATGSRAGLVLSAAHVERCHPRLCRLCFRASRPVQAWPPVRVCFEHVLRRSISGTLQIPRLDTGLGAIVVATVPRTGPARRRTEELPSWPACCSCPVRGRHGRSRPAFRSYAAADVSPFDPPAPVGASLSRCLPMASLSGGSCPAHSLL